MPMYGAPYPMMPPQYMPPPQHMSPQSPLQPQPLMNVNAQPRTGNPRERNQRGQGVGMGGQNAGQENMDNFDGNFRDNRQRRNNNNRGRGGQNINNRQSNNDDGNQGARPKQNRDNNRDEQYRDEHEDANSNDSNRRRRRGREQDNKGNRQDYEQRTEQDNREDYKRDLRNNQKSSRHDNSDDQRQTNPRGRNWGGRGENVRGGRLPYNNTRNDDERIASMYDHSDGVNEGSIPGRGRQGFGGSDSGRGAMGFGGRANFRGGPRSDRGRGRGGRDGRGTFGFRGRGTLRRGPRPDRGHVIINMPDGDNVDIAIRPDITEQSRGEDDFSLFRRGSFKRFSRNSRSFRGNIAGRGMHLRGGWSGLVGRKGGDYDSSSTVDDIDDNMSTTSEISCADSSFADDVSELGNDDKKLDISLDDIHTINLVTLNNRIKRYRRKLTTMKNNNESKDEVKKFQGQIEEIVRVKKERESSEKTETNDISSSSDEAEIETRKKPAQSKCNNAHARLAVKGQVSYRPKSRKKAKGKAVVKKRASKFTDTDSDYDEEVVSDSESDTDTVEEDIVDTNVRMKKLPRKQKTDGKNVEPDDKREKLLTDILSKLDNITIGAQPTMSKPTKTKSKPRKSKQSSDANSQSSSSSLNDSNISAQGDLMDGPHNAVPINTKQTGVKRESKLSESKSRGPDVNEVFKFIVKTLDGKGTPEEIKRESGFFPIDCDEIGWFRKVKRRFTLIERNGTIDLVLVSNTEATYCLDYITNRSCSKPDCNRYHVCKHMLAGNCIYGDGCKFSHNFLDDRNMTISKQLGFSNVFSSDEICFILRVRYPHMCGAWIDNGICNEANCIGLHMCPRYLLGLCLEGDSCSLIHDKSSPHNKPITDAYCMGKWQDNVFRKMVYMVRHPVVEGREEPSEITETNELKPTSQQDENCTTARLDRHTSGGSEQEVEEMSMKILF